MGNLPHNVRCLVEAFNTSRSNGNIPNNPTYLHVFVPWGKGKADVTQGEHCQLWGTDHRVWGLGRLGWGSGPGPAELLELLFLETKQALPSSWSVLLWPNTASMFTLINIPHASKPSAFLSYHHNHWQWGPAPSNAKHWQFLHYSSVCWVLWAVRLQARAVAVRKDQTNAKAAAQYLLETNQRVKKTSKKLLYISEGKEDWKLIIQGTITVIS